MAWLGHKNIQHTVRYTELAPDRFKDLWKTELGKTHPNESGRPGWRLERRLGSRALVARAFCALRDLSRPYIPSKRPNEIVDAPLFGTAAWPVDSENTNRLHTLLLQMGLGDTASGHQGYLHPARLCHLSRPCASGLDDDRRGLRRLAWSGEALAVVTPLTLFASMFTRSTRHRAHPASAVEVGVDNLPVLRLACDLQATRMHPIEGLTDFFREHFNLAACILDEADHQALFWAQRTIPAARGEVCDPTSWLSMRATLSALRLLR
jgi:hypothetical protein